MTTMALRRLYPSAGARVLVSTRPRGVPARRPGIDEKLMKPSQVLATQTNSSDVERPTEGTVGVAIRGRTSQYRRPKVGASTAQASVIDTLALQTRNQALICIGTSLRSWFVLRHLSSCLRPSVFVTTTRARRRLSCHYCKSLQLPHITAAPQRRLVNLYAIEQTQ